MANLTLELNIYSAKDLENVNLITKMDVYAVVKINGDDSHVEEKTGIDRTGGSEPTWNQLFKFSVNQRLAREDRLTLVVKLVCDRIFGGKDIGEVQVPVLELLLSSSPSYNGNGNSQGMSFVTYQVRTPCGKGQGSLTFSYRFDTTSSFKPDLPGSPVYQNQIETPSFKPDLPGSPVYQNPIDTPPDFHPPPSEGGFYPPLSSIGYPPSLDPQVYSASPYLYPNPNQYDSLYPEHLTAYPLSPSGSNLYPPPFYCASPPHHPYVYPPPGHSYHQAQPCQSYHVYPQPSP